MGKIDYKPVTVGQLVALLAGLNQSALVMVEGCDCSAPCIGYSVDPEGDVMLRREYGESDGYPDSPAVVTP